ncbi:MAG: DNA primase [Cyanobacteria bacterium SIG30]|nr:DNA primase [Cyanobacteria bacterium SIG30]
MVEYSFQEAVEKIKNSLDIVEVISRYVVLKKSGHNMMGLCPFHNEKTPSFVVTPSKQYFKCFGCGEGGDVLNFLMKINNQSFNEVIQEQAEILGIELPKGQGKDISEKRKKEKERLYLAMKNAVNFFQNNLLANEKALEYLEKRGVKKDVIDKFHLGLSLNSKNALKEYLKKEEQGAFTNDELTKAGLVFETENEYMDRFRNRIMIPIFDISDKCVGFGARAIMEGQSPKYLNSPESEIYNKSNILFGLNTAKEAIKEEDSAIIMEGYFDVISAQANGVQNTVASCGTALTPQHIKLLSRYTQSRKIYLAFDTDGAGLRAAKSGGQTIKEIFKNLGNVKQYDSSYAPLSNTVCEIRVVSQLSGKDPDEFIREFGADEYKAQIKKAPLFLDFEIQQVLKNKDKNITAQEKSILVQQMVEILSEIENEVILSDYVRNIAYKLNVDEKIIKKQIDKFKIEKEALIVKKNEVENKVAKTIKNTAQDRYFNMENNLIKLALSADTVEKRVYFEQSIKGLTLENEINKAILSNIDKMLTKVNNVNELAKKLFAQFCNDDKVQKHLTDLTYSSDEFADLSYEDFTQALKEVFDRLKNLKIMLDKNEIRAKYKNNNTTEEEQIRISKEIYEKFGHRR